VAAGRPHPFWGADGGEGAVNPPHRFVLAAIAADTLGLVLCASGAQRVAARVCGAFWWGQAVVAAHEVVGGSACVDDHAVGVALLVYAPLSVHLKGW
jgi:hypothetical protein